MNASPDNNDRHLYESGTIPVSHSEWSHTGESPSWPSLSADLDTDVVVIGAGLAGSSVALHLAERGVSTVVLEAAQPGEGASGRNAGHVMPLIDDFGALKHWPKQGEAFLELLASQRDIVFDLARRHNIEANCVNSGMIEAAFSNQKSFEHKATRWRGLGYDVQTIGAGQLSELLGTDKYKHGLHWKEGGIVNPYRFSNGMIAAANRCGASIFGNSRVTGCERDASGWRVRTANGSVRAAKVILCTSGNVGNSFFPQLVNTQFPLVAAAMATKPLPGSLIDIINPSRAAFLQAPIGLYPFVIDENNRLITATIPGPRSSHDGQSYFELLLRYLHRTWPATREAKIEMSTYWTGMCACSSSVIHADYPKLYQVDDGVIGFMNLGTWGNVLGPLLGMNLANAIADERMDELVIPLEVPAPVRFRQALQLKLRYALIPLARIVDRLGLA